MKYHLLFIAILGLLFTAVLNADLLYMVQERSLFMSGSIFFADCMRVPGGFLTWLALWFTQLFYYPYLGGSVLVLLWMALYVVLYRTFRPDPSWSWLLLVPVVALIVSTVDLGYWIYILKQHGYWFRETLGTLFVALFLWLDAAGQKVSTTADVSPQPRKQQIFSLVSLALALCAYPFLGWYAVLAMLCIIIRNVCSAVRTHTSWVKVAAAVVVPLIVPPFIARQYSAFRNEEALYAVFPVIESNLDFSWILTLPFIVVALSVIIFCVCPLHKPLTLMQRRPWLIHVATMIVLALITFERNVGDRLYHAEMRMYRQVEDFKWREVLDEIRLAGEKGGSTRQMALCKDIALINTQQIEKIFELSNGDANRVMRDSCGAHMFYTAGPLLALHHGMTNTAIRWTIETTVEYGLNVTYLKILTLAALINGESKVADKYLSMLNLNLFQSGWVRRYRPLAKDPSLMSEYPELTTIDILNKYPDNELHSDQGNVEAEVYKPFSNLINLEMHDVQPLGIYYALKEKNPVRFWAQLRHFVEQHPGQKVPVIFQEAAFLFHHHNPDETGGMKMNFPKELTDHFDAFNNYASTHARPDMSQEEIGAILKPKFGKTYWWYYYFNHTALY